MTECTITSLCHQQFEIITSYPKTLTEPENGEDYYFETTVEYAADNDKYIGDVISLDDKTFDFQFGDGSMAYGLEKKLWSFG